jgi:hypothetical protein
LLIEALFIGSYALLGYDYWLLRYGHTLPTKQAERYRKYGLKSHCELKIHRQVETEVVGDTLCAHRLCAAGLNLH